MKKIVFIIIISLFLFNNSDVLALTVTPKLTSKYETGITWDETGNGGTSGDYDDHQKVIPLNGHDYPAFCVDPGLKLRANQTYECESITDAGLSHLMDAYTSGAHDYPTVQLAFRFYANSIGVGSAKISELKMAIIRFRQLKNGIGYIMHQACAESGVTCSDDPYDYLSGNKKMVDDALSLARDAHTERLHTRGRGQLTNSFSLSVTVTKVSNNGNTVKYRIHSKEKISNMEFGCKNCTITSSVWMQTKGEITVIPNSDCEDYDIELYYAPSGIQICKRKPYSEDYQWLVTQFDESLSDYNSLDKSNPAQVYTEKGTGCGQTCCSPDLQSDYVVGDINNCCYESTHSYAKQYELDELFCADSELQIPLFKDRCKNDSYVDKNSKAYLNSYCELYCTERVTIDLPGAVTATSGRYFTLKTNLAAPAGYQTTSPYIFGVKRCRMIVNYDKWEADYYAAVEKQVEKYNEFQQKKAYQAMYDDAIAASTPASETITATCRVVTQSRSCSYEETTEDCEETETEDCKESKLSTITSGSSEELTKTVVMNYTKYPFHTLDVYPRQWREVRTNTENKNAHRAIEIEAKNSVHGTSHVAWSAWNNSPTISEVIKDVDDWIKEHDGKTIPGSQNSQTVPCSISTVASYWECSRNETEAEYAEENVVGKRDEYADAAASANKSFNSYAQQGKDLEEKLDKCDFFFEKYEGANAETMYNFSPSLTFSYDQIYLNAYGEKDKGSIEVNFVENPGCVIEGPITGDDEDINGKVYSPVYSVSGDINRVRDFAVSTLEYVEDATDGFAKYLDTTYNASKVFTHDAKYIVNCAWSESNDQLNTLVPSGEVSSSTKFNYTIHEKEYQVYITTFNGRYDIKWGLNGIGEKIDGNKGKFDNFIADTGGSTCSGDQTATEQRFTCGLEVTHEIIFVGKCNPDLYTTGTPENCDINSGTRLFTFKIVDPGNFFPTGTTDEDGKAYAYNWTSTEEGRLTMQAINKKAEKTNTYAPDNISYSFTLTPTDMRHIKNYNTEQNTKGGYSDFNMNCECPSSVQTNSAVNGEGCGKCKSTFLDNLEDGFVKYDSASHNIDVWASPNSLDNVRTRAHWAGVN